MAAAARPSLETPFDPARGGQDARSHLMTVGRSLVAAFNERRLESLAEMLAADVSVIAHGRELAGGRDGFISAARQLHETFDGARFEVEEEIVASDVVVQVLTFRERHVGGDYLGMAPSGIDVAIHRIWILHTDGQQIRAIREEWDGLGLVRQLEARSRA
jgi:predicted ester cyclase